MSNVRREGEVRCAARMGRSFAAGRAAALNEAAGDGAVSRIGCRVTAEQCSVSASPRGQRFCRTTGRKTGERTNPSGGHYRVSLVWCMYKHTARKCLRSKGRLACEPWWCGGCQRDGLLSAWESMVGCLWGSLRMEGLGATSLQAPWPGAGRGKTHLGRGLRVRVMHFRPVPGFACGMLPSEGTLLFDILGLLEGAWSPLPTARTQCTKGLALQARPPPLMLGVSMFETASQGVELFVLKLSSQRFPSVLICYKYWKQSNQCKFPDCCLVSSLFSSVFYSLLIVVLLATKHGWVGGDRQLGRGARRWMGQATESPTVSRSTETLN